MQANADRTRTSAGPAPGPAEVDGLHAAIAGLLHEAARFVSPSRIEELARGWLARTEFGHAELAGGVLLVADALGMATDLALFTPSASGATAFDRLARARSPGQPGEAAVLEALRRSQFRLLRVEALGDGGTIPMRDVASGGHLYTCFIKPPLIACGHDEDGPFPEDAHGSRDAFRGS